MYLQSFPRGVSSKRSTPDDSLSTAMTRRPSPELAGELTKNGSSKVKKHVGSGGKKEHLYLINFPFFVSSKSVIHSHKKLKLLEGDNS